MNSLVMNSTQKIKPGTKILFANFPADGHFNPLTSLAMQLKQAGCDVRWYTSTYYADKLNNLDIPHYRVKRSIDFDGTSIEKHFPEREKEKTQVKKLVFDIINAFILRGPEYFEDIKEIKEEFDFELMVADTAFTAIPFVKEKLNVPVVAVGVFPLSETSKDLPPYGLGIIPSYSLLGKAKQAVLRFVADKILFAKPNKVLNQVFNSHGLSTEGWSVFDVNIRKSTLFLQSGTPGFEYERSDLSSNIRFIGPLLPYSRNKKDTRWYNEKLERYSKVILVTQGTVEKDVTKIIVPTLEAFKDSSYLIIATTGGSDTERLRAAYPHNNIIIEDFIPFNEVMPYADIYISNGGYGGVLLGIQNGLPLLVAGVHEGKNEINSRVEYFKLGVNLRSETPAADQIKSAVENVYASPEYTRNVMRLKKEFKNYDPAKLFENYVSGLLRSNKINIPKKAVALEEEIY
jgi:MGT family glycosyltransferase